MYLSNLVGVRARFIEKEEAGHSLYLLLHSIEECAYPNRQDSSAARAEQSAALASLAASLEVRSLEIRSALVAQGLMAATDDAEEAGTRKGVAFEEEVCVVFVVVLLLLGEC